MVRRQSPDFYAAFRSGRGDLYEKNADGSGEERLLLQSNQDKLPTSASADGKYLLFSSRDLKTDNDLWLLRLDVPQPAAMPFLNTPDGEVNAQFSPDRRWIAYTATRGGAPEIIVRPFPDTSKDGTSNDGAKWLIAPNAIQPRWNRNGSRLYFTTLSGEVQFVDVDPGPSWQTSAVRRAFVGMPPVGFSLSPSGDRILLTRSSAGSGPPPPFTLVLNWLSRVDQ